MPVPTGVLLFFDYFFGSKFLRFSCYSRHRALGALMKNFASSVAFVVAVFFALAGVSHVVAATELASSADKIRPVLLGTKLLDVALKTVDGKNTTLKEQVADKPAVLVFYRGGWCPYCSTQLRDLRLIKAELEQLGFRIIAISPDRVEEVTSTMGKEKLDYVLLSDSKADALRAFGIGFQVDADTFKKYQGFGIDLEKASGETHRALPAPSAFIFDQAGVLQFSYVNPDYTARVPGNVLLAAAQAVAGKKQFVKPKK
jgi:peroxiredoxin